MYSSSRAPRSRGVDAQRGELLAHPARARPRGSACRRDSRWTLAASAATITGLRYGSTSTLVPSRSRSQREATKASVVSGSSHCMPGVIAISVPERPYGYSLSRSWDISAWSAAQTESKSEPLRGLGHRQQQLAPMIEPHGRQRHPDLHQTILRSGWRERGRAAEGVPNGSRDTRRPRTRSGGGRRCLGGGVVHGSVKRRGAWAISAMVLIRSTGLPTVGLARRSACSRSWGRSRRSRTGSC